MNLNSLSIEDINKLREYAKTIPKFTYKYIKSIRVVHISIEINNIIKNAYIRCFSGEFSNRMRGYQFDFIWIDEWLKFMNAAVLIDQVNFCLRVGMSKCIITTTPVQHDALIDIIRKTHSVYITQGTSHENKALSSTFCNYIENCDDNTLINREINANVSVSRLWIHNSFIYKNIPDCSIYRLGIDIAVTNGIVGIVLIGIYNNRIYVIKDYAATSLNWVIIVKEVVNKYYPIEIIYETNQGGNLIPSLLTLHNIRCNYSGVRAMKSKKLRHADLYVYYTMQLIYHSKDVVNLENEMLLYKKFDRIDALWCCLHNIENIIYIGEI